MPESALLSVDDAHVFKAEIVKAIPPFALARWHRFC